METVTAKVRVAYLEGLREVSLGHALITSYERVNSSRAKKYALSFHSSEQWLPLFVPRNGK